MITVHKFNLLPFTATTHDIPAGAEILSVNPGTQGIKLFAKVDTDLPKEQRRFLAAKTGEPLPDEVVAYHGTATQVGKLAFHIFEVSLDYVKPEPEPEDATEDEEEEAFEEEA